MERRDYAREVQEQFKGVKPKRKQRAKNDNRR